MEWIDRELFPFESRFIEIEGQRLHYIDEGQGPVILFSHGTPEWCFGWRDVIKPLRQHFRCIAPDLLGMGLSDKPTNGDYSVPAHARRLEAFIGKLGLEAVNIVGNDFGLSIALSYAINHPDNVQKISIFNGWMWRLDQDPHYASPMRFFSSGFGKWLYKRFNFPVNVIMPAAFGNRRRYLKPAVHQHYKKALPNAQSRTAAYAFVHEMFNAGEWWQGLWERRDWLRDKPMLIFWGMKDKFIPAYELDKWVRAFPDARVIRCPEAGHFVQEEEAGLMAAEWKAFFGV